MLMRDHLPPDSKMYRAQTPQGPPAPAAIVPANANVTLPSAGGGAVEPQPPLSAAPTPALFGGDDLFDLVDDDPQPPASPPPDPPKQQLNACLPQVTDLTHTRHTCLGSSYAVVARLPMPAIMPHSAHHPSLADIPRRACLIRRITHALRTSLCRWLRSRRQAAPRLCALRSSPLGVGPRALVLPLSQRPAADGSPRGAMNTHALRDQIALCCHTCRACRAC
jgi:hypothetical protein